MRSATSRALANPLKRAAIPPRSRSQSTTAAPASSLQNNDSTDEARWQRRRRPRGRETIFSGIQPTGIPHLGNYLGALRQWRQLQDAEDDDSGSTTAAATTTTTTRKGHQQPPRYHRCFFSVVDLHALTGQQDARTLRRSRRETFAALLAVGLDPRRSVIFMQSDVSHHAELMWILSTVASTGYLSRMTQWKSKLDLPESASLEEETARAKLKLGLFSYPVLQAADVLLYQTTLVPVGEDQLQHIEFARGLANSFNHLYGDVFVLPEAKISPAKRIMSLKDPTVKMSKSHPDPKSRILITDTAEEVHSKIKSALTDSEEGISYDPERRPGVSNLLDILKHTTRSSSSATATCTDIAADLQGTSMRAFKELVAQEVVKCLAGIRERFLEVMDDQGDKKLQDAMNEGRMRATAKAGSTMRTVRMALGLDDVKEA